jgi:hypothetical protein
MHGQVRHNPEILSVPFKGLAMQRQPKTRRHNQDLGGCPLAAESQLSFASVAKRGVSDVVR